MFIYKNTEKDEDKFLESIFKSLAKKTALINIDQEIAHLTSNPNLQQLNNLMLFHWYERRTGKCIINETVLSGLNPSTKYESKRDLKDEIIDRKNSFMDSAKYEGFTVYYEYYFDFFPELDKITFEEFSGRYFYDYLLELFPTIAEIDFKSQKKFFRFKKKDKPLDSEYYRTLYYKHNNLPSFYPFEEGRRFTYSPASLITTERHHVENLVRLERGLPKVGEGWISETRLYYSIKNAFENLEVIHHASPEWLGRQHFDIYIPEYNLAIEYQGIQHSRPVEFFGGESTFIQNQERDERKRRLCDDNGCYLIYAYPEDEHSEIIKRIKKAMPNNR